MVLPEVLRNPVAFFITNKSDKQVPQVITQLIKNVTQKPKFTPVISKQIRRKKNKIAKNKPRTKK